MLELTDLNPAELLDKETIFCYESGKAQIQNMIEQNQKLVMPSDILLQIQSFHFRISEIIEKAVLTDGSEYPIWLLSPFRYQIRSKQTENYFFGVYNKAANSLHWLFKGIVFQPSRKDAIEAYTELIPFFVNDNNLLPFIVKK